MLVLGGLAHVPNLFARHTFIFHFFEREHRLKDGECSQWFMRLAGCIGNVNDICTVNLLHPMAFPLNERGKGGELAEGGSPRFGNCTLHRSTAPLLLQWRHFQFEFYFALLIYSIAKVNSPWSIC